MEVFPPWFVRGIEVLKDIINSGTLVRDWIEGWILNHQCCYSFLLACAAVMLGFIAGYATYHLTLNT